jgi:predicted N-acetyltransferase YhbS
MRISVEHGEETAEVRQFINLVWPPRQPAPESLLVARIVWDTNYSRRILTRNDDGKILSQVALIFRGGHWNGEPLRVGGIAGVKTDPEFRDQRLATAGMRRAAETLVEASFDIGFCVPGMMPFYQRLGWRRFNGAVFIKQPGNDHMPRSGCMTLAVKNMAVSSMLLARRGDRSERISKSLN